MGDPQIGAVFPQAEMPADASDVRRFVHGVEQLGYRHLLVYDQVVGSVHQDPGPFGIRSLFHEPFVLLAFVAATTSLELATAVVVLPQRQTALVAKQAVEVDVLSSGRLRLGVAVGQNRYEYEALGEDFGSRGKRIEYQVQLLRRLWTEEVLDFSSPREILRGSGIAPLPRQRPIPIWFGASSRVALKRVGRLGDGWFPEMQPGPEYSEALAVVRESAETAGRDPAAIQVEGRVHWQGSLDRLLRSVQAWRRTDATYLSVNTLGRGFTSASEHLEALERIAASLGLP